MDDQLLFHDDATALMAGSLPQDRPDLVVLAAAIHGYRDAYVAPAPQASPELMGWLSGTPTPPRNGTEVPTAATPVRARASARRWRRTAASALTGWGVAAQIALGGTAAFAMVATAGAVGVLPDGPQVVFDRILDTNRTEAPPPNTPVDEGADIDAPLAPGPDEQRFTKPRSPSQDTPARQDPDSENTSQDTTGDRPRGERETAPSSDESDESANETKKDPDDRSDDRPGKDDSQTGDKEEQDDNRAGAEEEQDDRRADTEEEQDDRRADDAGDLSDRTEDADEVTTVDGDVD